MDYSRLKSSEHLEDSESEFSTTESQNDEHYSMNYQDVIAEMYDEILHRDKMLAAKDLKISFLESCVEYERQVNFRRRHLLDIKDKEIHRLKKQHQRDMDILKKGIAKGRDGNAQKDLLKKYQRYRVHQARKEAAHKLETKKLATELSSGIHKRIQQIAMKQKFQRQKIYDKNRLWEKFNTIE